MIHIAEIHKLFGLLIAVGKSKPKDNVPATIANELGYSKYTVTDWLNTSKSETPSKEAMQKIIKKNKILSKELSKTLDK